MDAFNNEQTEIRELCHSYGLDPSPYTRMGLSEAKLRIADRITRARTPGVQTTDIGVELNDRERESYSVARAIVMAATGGSSLETEISATLEKRLDRPVGEFGILIPLATRALNITTAGQGKESVATEIQDMIDYMRNRLVLAKAGIQTLAGLRGNVAFPRLTAIASALMKAESTTSVSSDAAFDQVTMAPHKATVDTSYTMEFLAQSTLDVEAFVRHDLGTVHRHVDRLHGLHGRRCCPESKRHMESDRHQFDRLRDNGCDDKNEEPGRTRILRGGCKRGCAHYEFGHHARSAEQPEVHSVPG